MSTDFASSSLPVDVKTAAHQLIDSLPADANWDDVIYHAYVRKCIEAGLADADVGRGRDVNDVRKEFGLGPCE
ncbi:hypothetical protein [Anatilimnocola floriformis]|uniref:hypothetical protein n=1 Tax=Anatilimnocola floriformis TaxID=2948575 RepID=UPI0020C5966E|nr:hypothetical protein [Anatilimnocola floriformis]